MSKGRSIYLQIVKNFVNSLKPRSFRGEQVGKDHFGNTYHQITDPGQRRQRWFTPTVKDNYEQELPAEWESWLRYRRKVPPTEEEVLANAQIAAQKKVNAAKLDGERKVKIEAPKRSTGAESFPSYEEFEVFPGKRPPGEKG